MVSNGIQTGRLETRVSDWIWSECKENIGQKWHHGTWKLTLLSDAISLKLDTVSLTILKGRLAFDGMWKGCVESKAWQRSDTIRDVRCEWIFTTRWGHIMEHFPVVHICIYCSHKNVGMSFFRWDDISIRMLAKINHDWGSWFSRHPFQ